MNAPDEFSGPQFRGDRPVEQESVRTTIVGGRPPGSGQPLGSIPRGIEVLIKKAAVDPPFCDLLLAKRSGAAEAIGLALEPAEAAMLKAIPRGQLEAIIARTSVPQEQRRAFLGQAAAVMLAAIAVTTAGCPLGHRPDRPPGSGRSATKGIRPDRPLENKSGPAATAPEGAGSERPEATSKQGPPAEAAKNVDSKKSGDQLESPVSPERPRPEPK